MFCNRCGKQVSDDSLYCPYCGSNIRNLQSEKEFIDHYIGDLDHYTQLVRKRAGSKLQKITKICCYISLVTFLLLYIRIAPGRGFYHVLSYIAGAAAAVLLIVFFYRKSIKSVSKSFYGVSLLMAVAVFLSAACLQITYEAKLDAALADFPSHGTVHLRVHLDEEFYSLYGVGMAYRPYSSIRLGDTVYQDGDTMDVAVNTTYPATINCGYLNTSGHTQRDLRFTPSLLKDGYTIVEKVDFDDITYANVTLSFTRTCTFWEVILH